MSGNEKPISRRNKRYDEEMKDAAEHTACVNTEPGEKQPPTLQDELDLEKQEEGEKERELNRHFASSSSRRPVAQGNKRPPQQPAHAGGDSSIDPVATDGPQQKKLKSKRNEGRTGLIRWPSAVAEEAEKQKE
jgi:hypothetical protein